MSTVDLKYRELLGFHNAHNLSRLDAILAVTQMEVDWLASSLGVRSPRMLVAGLPSIGALGCDQLSTRETLAKLPIVRRAAADLFCEEADAKPPLWILMVGGSPANDDLRNSTNAWAAQWCTATGAAVRVVWEVGLGA